MVRQCFIAEKQQKAILNFFKFIILTESRKIQNIKKILNFLNK